MMPEHLVSTCELCGVESIGVNDMISHLDEVHDLQAERWPDGELVVDMSDVPELMEEH